MKTQENYKAIAETRFYRKALNYHKIKQPTISELASLNECEAFCMALGFTKDEVNEILNKAYADATN